MHQNTFQQNTTQNFPARPMNLWNYMAVVSPALKMFKKNVGRNRYVVQDPLEQQDGLRNCKA